MVTEFCKLGNTILYVIKKIKNQHQLADIERIFDEVTKAQGPLATFSSRLQCNMLHCKREKRNVSGPTWFQQEFCFLQHEKMLLQYCALLQQQKYVS